MNAVVQAEFEFPQASPWSEETLCLAWVTQSDGSAWEDWWDSLPNYRRESILASYRHERHMADLLGRRMRPYSSTVPSREEIEQDRAIIVRFMDEIRRAALERRPMPLSVSEDMSPSERATFRRRLQTAMLEAGVVIVEAAPATQDSRGRTPSAARPRPTRG